MPMTYLRIRGTLHENMTFTPRAGLESGRALRETGDPAFRLVLLDAGDRPLVSVAPRVTPRACGAGGEPVMSRVSGYAPLHPDAVAYELRKGDVTFHRAAIAERPPAPPEVEAEETKTGVTLRWKADGDTLVYSVVAEVDKGPRLTLARGVRETKLAVTWSETPLSGDGRILVIASDGVRSTAREAFRFALPVAPPTVHILSPSGPEPRAFGQPLSLIGVCLDRFGAPIEHPEVEWRIDGQGVAKGGLIAVAYEPPEGEHDLTLVARLDGREVSATQKLVVAAPDEDYRVWRETTTAR